MKTNSPQFLKVYNNDPLVYHIMNSGGSLAEVIVAMNKRHEKLTGEMLELHAIAPKKITVEPGKVMVWNCPDHLIPDNGFQP